MRLQTKDPISDPRFVVDGPVKPAVPSKERINIQDPRENKDPRRMLTQTGDVLGLLTYTGEELHRAGDPDTYTLRPRTEGGAWAAVREKRNPERVIRATAEEMRWKLSPEDVTAEDLRMNTEVDQRILRAVEQMKSDLTAAIQAKLGNERDAVTLGDGFTGRLSKFVGSTVLTAEGQPSSYAGRLVLPPEMEQQLLALARASIDGSIATEWRRFVEEAIKGKSSVSLGFSRDINAWDHRSVVPETQVIDLAAQIPAAKANLGMRVQSNWMHLSLSVPPVPSSGGRGRGPRN